MMIVNKLRVYAQKSGRTRTMRELLIRKAFAFGSMLSTRQSLNCAGMMIYELKGYHCLMITLSMSFEDMSLRTSCVLFRLNATLIISPSFNKPSQPVQEYTDQDKR